MPMTRPQPQSQEQYLHAIWEAVGKLEGSLATAREAQTAICAERVQQCQRQFDELKALAANGNGGAVVSVKDVRSIAKWLAPWVGKGVALAVLMLALFLAGRGQLAADVAKRVMQTIAHNGTTAPKPAAQP